MHIPFAFYLIFLTNRYIFVTSRLPQLAVLAKILCLLMVSVSIHDLSTITEIIVSPFRDTSVYLFVSREASRRELLEKLSGCDVCHS